jgi:hypothetical protein
MKVNKQRMETGNLYTCDNRIDGTETSAGYFIPIYVGELATSG